MILLAGTPACDRPSYGGGKPNDAGAGQGPEGHDQAHEAGGLEPISVTLFTPEVLLFVEYPQLVVGGHAAFLAHVTVLGTGEPVRSGTMTFELTTPGGAVRKQVWPAPRRDGLFVPEWDFAVAGVHGLRLIVDSPQVQETISSAVGGVKAGQVFEGVRRYDIYVRFPEKYRSTADEIREILVPTPSGSRKPLGELAEIREVTGPRQITREDNQRFISIQCNVVGRDIGSFVEEAQRSIDRAVQLPAGYFTTWGGQFRLQQEANRRLAVVVPITLLIIGLLLYGAFNSFKNALLILLNIPLALVGGVAALWISGQNLSVPASVGFISLFGIAVQNGLVLINHINQLVRDGKPMDEASVEGGCARLRAVLMTASTTALGLIPLLLATGTGSEVQRPLAAVVIGGLVTSTALTLLVLPALYKWFAIPVEADIAVHASSNKSKEGDQ